MSCWTRKAAERLRGRSSVTSAANIGNFLESSGLGGIGRLRRPGSRSSSATIEMGERQNRERRRVRGSPKGRPKERIPDASWFFKEGEAPTPNAARRGGRGQL